MNKGWVWAAYILFALCLIGSVAWPLWSDSDLWMLGFGALAVIIIFPVILWPAIRAVMSAFNMKEPPSGGTSTP
jgi:hypothetical protein